MRYSALFATAFAISAANATFLPLLKGGWGGSGSGSGSGSTSSSGSTQPCDGSGSTTGTDSVETVYVSACDLGDCDGSGQASGQASGTATTGGSASGSTSGQAAASSEVPTDMFSQMIGGLSNILETGFSGSGSLLHNLIG
ncbi:hypothetical protein Cantr_01707 [Candida viswanathii]|uniref:Uncharacterized protein n=1 Tax=Candida viswanathii TaxID=5486 RepID=A0A367YJ84_9ASCO|nr:hypothetical protein Cantr_01707 [Candida viswanathii]